MSVIEYMSVSVSGVCVWGYGRVYRLHARVCGVLM